MADAGCQCVYVVDSAGALILEQVSDRVSALGAEFGADAQVGFHAHENLALGVANSIAAIRAGAVQIDGSTRRFGAGAGNAPSEALVAVCDKLGIRTGIDVFKMFDAAEDVVRPVMSDECTLDRLSLVMGYSGVYSSFLQARLPRRRALRRLGRRDPRASRRTQARRWPGGPAARHRRRARGRAAPHEAEPRAQPSVEPRDTRRRPPPSARRAGRTSRRAGSRNDVAPASADRADPVDDRSSACRRGRTSRAKASASASLTQRPHTSTAVASPRRGRGRDTPPGHASGTEGSMPARARNPEPPVWAIAAQIGLSRAGRRVRTSSVTCVYADTTTSRRRVAPARRLRLPTARTRGCARAPGPTPR